MFFPGIMLAHEGGPIQKLIVYRTFHHRRRARKRTWVIRIANQCTHQMDRKVRMMGHTWIRRTMNVVVSVKMLFPAIMLAHEGGPIRKVLVYKERFNIGEPVHQSSVPDGEKVSIHQLGIMSVHHQCNRMSGLSGVSRVPIAAQYRPV
jgi:hypothetical protein